MGAPAAVSWWMLYRICIAAVLAWPAALGAQVPARTVAVTIDDLPKTGGSDRLTAATYVTDRILDALRRHEAPAVGFVTTSRAMVDGQIDARVALLRRWVAAGVELGNHTYSHPPFHGTPLRRYLDDAVQGDRVPRALMAERGDSLRYFRHPFNSTGPDSSSKAAFEAFAAERGWTIAPFTVEHADYAFDRIYTHAVETHDRALQDSVADAYLEHLHTAFAFAEALSRETFGREIPQVLLIHASEINAAHLDAMLGALAKRGYAFITLEEAMHDPAYDAPDGYVGRWGWSWLHRWRLGLGLDAGVRESPDPPAWVLERYEVLLRATR